MDKERPAAGAPRLALLWFVGIDLRLTVLCVPPVLPLIHRDLALDETTIAALTGLPVLLLALLAVPGALLIARLGAGRALIAGMATVALGGALRGLGPSTPMLFAMTFLMGAGIAVMQPALPALVGRWFPERVGFATATYGNGLLMGETFAAALTIPLVLPLVGGSWPLSFVFWSVPVLATTAAVALATRADARAGGAQRALWWPDWKSPATWELGLLLGGGSAVYFAANAFIPDYLHAAGKPELINAALTALNAGQLPASGVLLLLARRLVGRKAPLIAVACVSFLGLAGLLGASPSLIVAGAGLLGFAGAFLLILTLALPPLLAPAGDVHRLAAGMFTVGYLTAFLVPLLGGAAWDLSGIPATAFLPVVLGTGVVIAVAAVLRPRQTRGGPSRT